MPSSNPTNSKRPAHTWDKDDRIFVAVIDRFYIMSRNQQQQVFNRIYEERLASEGYNPGTYSGLAAQINDLKKGRAGSKYWTLVMQLPLGHALKAFERQRRDIEKVAKDINIGLHPKVVVGAAPAEIPIKPNSFKRTREEEEADIKIDSEIPSTQGHAGEIQCSVQPKKARQKFVSVELPKPTQAPPQQARSRNTAAGPSLLGRARIDDIFRNVRQSPKLTIQKDFEGNHSKKHPRLLYRAFEPAQGFTARKFLNNPAAIPSPPAFGTPEFLAEVEPHLHMDKTYKSPVLSFTQLPSYALKIIASAQPPRYLAIFDFDDLEEYSTDRFGLRCRPYPVGVLCKKHGLIGKLPGGYTGIYEWLVWGQTQCEPVAVFDTEQALELHSMLKSMQSLDEDTGKDLGKLLKDIDDERKEVVARSLVKCFKVPGCDTDYHRASWEDFADAIYAANNGDRATSVVSSFRGMSLDEETSRDLNYDAWSEFSGTVTEMGKSDGEEAVELLRSQGWEIVQEARETHSGFDGAQQNTYQDPQDDDSDSMQDLIDTQLMADPYAHGLAVDKEPSSGTLRESTPPQQILQGLEDYLEVATQSAPPPSPDHSIKSTFEATLPSSASSQPTIIDLTIDNDSDSDLEVEFEIIDAREATGTPVQEETAEDFVILGSGRRGRHILPLRSKSQSVKFLGTRKATNQRRANTDKLVAILNGSP